MLISDWSSDVCSSDLLYRGAARLRYRVGPDQRPCPQEHLWLQDDGVGHRHHRGAELLRLGASHVRQWNEPLFRVLIRNVDAYNRHSDRDQGLQLGADSLARGHPSATASAVSHLLSFPLLHWRPP